MRGPKTREQSESKGEHQGEIDFFIAAANRENQRWRDGKDGCRTFTNRAIDITNQKDKRKQCKGLDARFRARIDWENCALPYVRWVALSCNIRTKIAPCKAALGVNSHFDMSIEAQIAGKANNEVQKKTKSK